MGCWHKFKHFLRFGALFAQLFIPGWQFEIFYVLLPYVSRFEML